MLVWTNVRRGNFWWAKLVDASVARDLPGNHAEEDDTEGGSSIVRALRPASASGPAPTVPAWNELDHDSTLRDEVFAATGIRICNAD